MHVLGIETSCDETAVCLIEASGEFGRGFRFRVLGNALTSQAALHAKYGGVFPNLAKREHAKNLVPLLEHALTAADVLEHVPLHESGRLSLPDLREILAREAELYEQLSLFLGKYQKPSINAIAVTHGPGLEPALWVGVNFAKALSAVWNIPIVAVNHMEGHIVMSMIEIVSQSSGEMATFEFPLLALLISGGHTELVLSKEFGKYELIGQTRDDAAGEAFDKVARLLGLGYPGGPQISRLAEEARKKNIKDDITLPRPMLHEDNFDFSFSGLKTAVRRIVEAAQMTDEKKLQIAREFEDVIADVLVAKTLRAIDTYSANTLVVGGGVSANKHIRLCLAEALARAGAKLLVCPPEFSTDNAIMIALAGYFHAQNRDFVNPDMLRANGSLRLA